MDKVQDLITGPRLLPLPALLSQVEQLDLQLKHLLLALCRQAAADLLCLFTMCPCAGRFGMHAILSVSLRLN